MKLIILYGPPASGKYTIAKEIQSIAGYKIFHNHSIIDLCHATLDPGSRRFWNFSRKIRIDVIREAIKENIPCMTMTMAYTGVSTETGFITKTIKIVEKAGGKVYLVKLNCHKEHIKKRVLHKSRKNFRKVQDKSGIEEWLSKYDSTALYPGRKSLVLDSGKLSAKQSAKNILRYAK